MQRYWWCPPGTLVSDWPKMPPLYIIILGPQFPEVHYILLCKRAETHNLFIHSEVLWIFGEEQPWTITKKLAFCLFWIYHMAGIIHTLWHCVLIKPYKIDNLVPFYTWENGGSDRLSDLPRHLQTGRERCEIQIPQLIFFIPQPIVLMCCLNK
jgi:hypothetical protein